MIFIYLSKPSIVKCCQYFIGEAAILKRADPKSQIKNRVVQMKYITNDSDWGSLLEKIKEKYINDLKVDIIMNTLGDEVLHYSGFKIRYAKLYNWIDSIEKIDDEIDFIQTKIIKDLNENKLSFSNNLGINFESSDISYCTGEYGDFIDFPVFSKEDGIKLKGKIRINPCFSYKYQHDILNRHYSKIWCIVENDEQILLDGKDIQDLLKTTRSFCGKVTKTIGEYYLKFVDKSSEPEIKKYWTSIESIMMSKKDAIKKGVESLFILDDEQEFLDSYKKFPASKRSLKDIIGWIHHKKIGDPLNFICDKKNIDIKWRVLKNDDTNIFYARKNTDEQLHLIGLGIPKSGDDNVHMIDKAFKPQIASLIRDL